MSDLPKMPPNDISFRQTREAADHLDAHLNESIAVLSRPTESPHPMRGMKRLANLTPTIMAAIDQKADAVADQLVAQQERAEQAIGKFSALATSIGQTADEIEAALGQISNDPTQVSGA